MGALGDVNKEIDNFAKLLGLTEACLKKYTKSSGSRSDWQTFKRGILRFHKAAADLNVTGPFRNIFRSYSDDSSANAKVSVEAAAIIYNHLKLNAGNPADIANTMAVFGFCLDDWSRSKNFAADYHTVKIEHPRLVVLLQAKVAQGTLRAALGKLNNGKQLGALKKDLQVGQKINMHASVRPHRRLIHLTNQAITAMHGLDRTLAETIEAADLLSPVISAPAAVDLCCRHIDGFRDSAYQFDLHA